MNAMTISEVVRIISNRLMSLQSQRTQAVMLGDLQQVSTLDAEIEETQRTLNALQSLAA